MAGRMGISEELVTNDMPYLNVYIDEIKEARNNDMYGDIDLKEIDEDMRLNLAIDCPFYKDWEQDNMYATVEDVYLDLVDQDNMAN